MSISAQISTINVPFHGDNLYLVSHNGEAYTPMKPIVEGMGMAWQTQHRKLSERFAKGITEMVIPSAGGSQSMTCLALRKLNGWLQTINPNKVKPEIRDRVIQYQEECDDVLYEYWTKGQVTNPRKAKKALPGKITLDQQETIKQLVLTRGKALPKESQAKAMITMWSALKTHFGCSYKEIAEDQFTEALSLAARVPLEGELLAKGNGKESSERTDLNYSRYTTRVIVYDELFKGCIEFTGKSNDFRKMATGICEQLGFVPVEFIEKSPDMKAMRRVY